MEIDGEFVDDDDDDDEEVPGAHLTDPSDDEDEVEVQEDSDGAEADEESGEGDKEEEGGDEEEEREPSQAQAAQRAAFQMAGVAARVRRVGEAKDPFADVTVGYLTELYSSSRFDEVRAASHPPTRGVAPRATPTPVHSGVVWRAARRRHPLRGPHARGAPPRDVARGERG